MADQAQGNGEQAKPLYPGNIDRYRGLRQMRASVPVYANDGDKEAGVVNPQHVGLCIAEELAGLAYILDGIRFAARKDKS